MGRSEDDHEPCCFLLTARGENSTGFKSDGEKIQSQIFQSRWVCFPQGVNSSAPSTQMFFRQRNALVWKGATFSGPAGRTAWVCPIAGLLHAFKTVR